MLQSRARRFREEKYSLSLPRFEPLLIQLIALVTVLTEISQLLALLKLCYTLVSF